MPTVKSSKVSIKYILNYRVHTNRVELADDIDYFVRSECFTANIRDNSTGPVVIARLQRFLIKRNSNQKCKIFIIL